MAQKDDALNLFDWDSSQSMQREDFRRVFLEETAKDRDPAEIASAIGEVARALGMAEIARQAGMPVDDVYAAVNAWPRQLDPLLDLLDRLGVERAAPRTDAAE